MFELTLADTKELPSPCEGQGRTLQAEGAASAKSLRQQRAGTFEMLKGGHCDCSLVRKQAGKIGERWEPAPVGFCGPQ